MHLAEMQRPQLSATTLAKVEALYHCAHDSIRALDWLIDQGFEPQAFVVGRAKRPVIQIANNSQCLKLKRIYKAYYYITRLGDCGHELVWRCEMFGCLVEWVEKGN